MRWRVRVQAGSAELYLRDTCGIPQDAVDAVMTKAVAWRITRGGRPLIDRRRRSRVERNLPQVADYLQRCGVPAGLPFPSLYKPYMKTLCKPYKKTVWGESL